MNESPVRSRESISSSRAEVRMVAQPVSVPAARRFVSDVLAGWRRDDVTDDITLCVSELATNATLHSDSPYFQVELEERAGTVRLAVADADNASATGRGMLLVTALATEWGIDELPVGKRIWGQFETGGPAAGDEDRAPATRLTWSAERERPVLDPRAWPVVRFRGCPSALLVAHDQNLDDYTRELHLVGDRLGEASCTRLAAALGGYLVEHAPNWDPARIIAREAVRDRREYVDFDVLADPDIRESLDCLRRLIAEAEALSAEGTLLTLPAAEPVQRLRDWMEGEFLAQIEDHAEPLSYPEWLAGARR